MYPVCFVENIRTSLIA